jgi:hypothetical protein
VVGEKGIIMLTLEKQPIKNDLSLGERMNTFIKQHFQGVEISTWHLCNLESFGLDPQKIHFDKNNLTSHFEKHEGSLPVHSELNYRKWIEIYYKRFFENSPGLVIAPQLGEPNKLQLIDLENMQVLIVAFNDFDSEKTNFVSFHKNNQPSKYKFLIESGIIRTTETRKIIERVIKKINGSQNKKKFREARAETKKYTFN